MLRFASSESVLRMRFPDLSEGQEGYIILSCYIVQENSLSPLNCLQGWEN